MREEDKYEMGSPEWWEWFKNKYPRPAEPISNPAAEKEYFQLGNVVEKITKATGIESVVKKIEKVTGRPCGCAGRKAALNHLIPKP